MSNQPLPPPKECDDGIMNLMMGMSFGFTVAMFLCTVAIVIYGMCCQGKKRCCVISDVPEDSYEAA